MWGLFQYGVYGVMLGMGVRKLYDLINENRIHDSCISPTACLLPYAVFLAGVASFFWIPLDLNLHSWSVVTIGLIVYVFLMWCDHLVAEERFAQLNDPPWWLRGPFRRAVKREGYSVSYQGHMVRNAFASRFGLIILGTGKSVGFWGRLLGRDGWDDTTREGILAHERWHAYWGWALFVPETLILYYFFTNLQWSWQIILLPPMLLAAYTLVAWLDELCADFAGGAQTWAYLKTTLEKSPWHTRTFGTVGVTSHPPIVLRYMACTRYPIIVAIAAAVAGIVWLRGWTG